MIGRFVKLLACTIAAVALIQFRPVTAIITEITPDELADGITTGLFNVIVDIRNRGEWDQGHIPNASFIEALASAGTANEVTKRLLLCRFSIASDIMSESGEIILLKPPFIPKRAN